MRVFSFFSPRYGPQAERLRRTCPGGWALEMFEVSQKEIDSKLRRHRGVYKNKFTGCDTKVQQVIRALDAAADGEVILWCDASTYFNGDRPPLRLPEGVDVLFASQRNSADEGVIAEEGLNIGVILMRKCAPVLGFWNDVKDAINTQKLWDQGVVNAKLGVGRNTVAGEWMSRVAAAPDLRWGVIPPGVCAGGVASALGACSTRPPSSSCGRG